MSPWAVRPGLIVCDAIVVRQRGCFHAVCTTRKKLRLVAQSTPPNTLVYASCYWGLACDVPLLSAYEPLRGFTARPVTCLACLAKELDV